MRAGLACTAPSLVLFQDALCCCSELLLVQAGKELDLPVYFGDAGSSAVLHSLGAQHAACAVITLDTPGRLCAHALSLAGMLLCLCTCLSLAGRLNFVCVYAQVPTTAVCGRCTSTSQTLRSTCAPTT